MRILIAVIVLMLSVESFGQARRKTSPVKPQQQQQVKSRESDDRVLQTKTTSSRYPLNSELYFVPHQKTTVQGSLGFAVQTYSLETPNSPIGFTSTDEMRSTEVLGQIEAAYGVLPNLLIGFEFGYGTSTLQNTSYKNTAGTVFPLEPDVKSSGLLDPQVYGIYRLVDSDLVVELGGALRFGFLAAENATAIDTNSDGRGDRAVNGNLANGSYGVNAGLRAGYQVGQSLNLIGSVSAEYNFDGTRASETIFGGVDVETDSYVVLGLRGVLEYFVTPDFNISPNATLTFTPKTKSRTLVGGSTFIAETAGYKTYSLGLTGSYLVQKDLAVKAGYLFTSMESSMTQNNSSGTMAPSSNSTNREAHGLVAGVALEF